MPGKAPYGFGTDEDGHVQNRSVGAQDRKIEDTSRLSEAEDGECKEEMNG